MGSPEDVSQIRTLPSLAPLRTVFPSGARLTQFTQLPTVVAMADRNRRMLDAHTSSSAVGSGGAPGDQNRRLLLIGLFVGFFDSRAF